jgi:hypothetical protein
MKMGKVVNITDKLDFENPKIVIKDEEYEIHADAENMIKVMGLMSDENANNVENMMSAGKLLFGENNFDKLCKGLPFRSFATVVQTAMSLAAGEDDEPAGEVMAHTTT